MDDVVVSAVDDEPDIVLKVANVAEDEVIVVPVADLDPCASRVVFNMGWWIVAMENICVTHVGLPEPCTLIYECQIKQLV
jgi:hypothetical protein